jgi:lambda family phage portal protein
MFDWFKSKPAPTPDKNGRAYMPSRTAARMYAASQQDRLSQGWGSMPLTADEVVDRNQRVIVARSREQCANNDYGKAFLRLCRQNIVGPQGITLQAQTKDDKGKLDKLANEAIEAGWAEWGRPENCDVTGKRSWRAIQTGCINSAAKDGEFIVRMVYGSDAGPWGFALQLIDPQRCPVDMNIQGQPNGNFTRQGIRFNRYGRPLAYFFTTTDETEATYSYGGKRYVEVRAEDIVHGFLEDMAGQKRGLPWTATGLFAMRQVNAMENAAIVNARVGANKLGFIEWKEGFGPELDEDDELIINSEPGEWQVLPEGAQVKETAPNYPSGEYAPFVKQALRRMAAGFGVLYNNLAGDLEGVNFSSIRQGTLDEREHWKELQEWLIETLIEPVFTRGWLPRALLTGRLVVKGRPLKAERIDRYRQVAWQGRRWQWIDPRADVDGAVNSKNNMLISPGAVIREQGRDPLNVWLESARDVRAMIDAYIAEGIDKKVAEELVLLSMGRQPPKPVPAPGGDKNAAE